MKQLGVEGAKTNLTISYEYLNVLASKEPIMFSGKVLKWNKYTIKQERHLIITNLNVYNFKKKKLRRRVPIEKLAGLTKLLRADN